MPCFKHRRLDQHAYLGLGPRCRELRGSCGGRAAEMGQVDQGARAQRPLSLFSGSFSPLTIRSSFLTSPPAMQKGALNGCAFGGGTDSRISAPGGEIEASILSNFWALERMRGFFAACGASFGSNSRGEYHQLQPGLLFGLKNPPVTWSMLSLRWWRRSLASERPFFRESRAHKARRFMAETACTSLAV